MSKNSLIFMAKIFLIFLIGVVDFILINQFIFPNLSCGSTIGESATLVFLVLVAIINIIAIAKIINYKPKK